MKCLLDVDIPKRIIQVKKDEIVSDDTGGYIMNATHSLQDSETVCHEMVTSDSSDEDESVALMMMFYLSHLQEMMKVNQMIILVTAMKVQQLRLMKETNL
ncbi:hypothetical protein DPMN_180614 [Dreissena polymorpha]|uniref:Uncharacterized protein n=1 Tax=Dreissena polymorpha TaxID=45954 RepID=A0A9D4ILT1_DREPO|nr:hypothetical protein DPMN_180614 [Dreissena polymorpha]